jgi:hypothetical protein
MMEMSDYFKVIEAKGKISEIAIFLLERFNLNFAKGFIASMIFQMKDDDAISIYEKIKGVVLDESK